MPKYEVVCQWRDRIIEANSPEQAQYKAMEMIERQDFDAQEIKEEEGHPWIQHTPVGMDLRRAWSQTGPQKGQRHE